MLRGATCTARWPASSRARRTPSTGASSSSTSSPWSRAAPAGHPPGPPSSGARSGGPAGPACWWWTRPGASCTPRAGRSWPAWPGGRASTTWGWSPSPRTPTSSAPPTAGPSWETRPQAPPQAGLHHHRRGAGRLRTLGRERRPLPSAGKGDGLLLAREAATPPDRRQPRRAPAGHDRAPEAVAVPPEGTGSHAESPARYPVRPRHRRPAPPGAGQTGTRQGDHAWRRLDPRSAPSPPGRQKGERGAGAGGRLRPQRLKREHPIATVVTAAGVALRPSGRALIGRCPPHDDGGPTSTSTRRTTRTTASAAGWAATPSTSSCAAKAWTSSRPAPRLDGLPAAPSSRSPWGDWPRRSPPAATEWYARRAPGTGAALGPPGAPGAGVLANCALTVYRRALWTDRTALDYVRRRAVPDWVLRECAVGYADGYSLEAALRRRSLLDVAEALGLFRRLPGRGHQSPAMMERPAWTSPHRRAWSGAPARGARRARGRARAARGPGVVVHRALPEGPPERPKYLALAASAPCWATSGRPGSPRPSCARGPSTTSPPSAGASRLQPQAPRSRPTAWGSSPAPAPSTARSTPIPPGGLQPTASGPCWGTASSPSPCRRAATSTTWGSGRAPDVRPAGPGSAAAGAHDRRRGPG